MAREVFYGFVYGGNKRRQAGQAGQPQQVAQAPEEADAGRIQTFTPGQAQEEIAAFKEAHRKSDVDFAPGSLHHTLGTGPGQAAGGSDLEALRVSKVGRVGTTKVESNSGLFTAETVIMTVVARVEKGYTYRVRTLFLGDAGVNGDNLTGRIREDSVSGTVLWDYTQVIENTTRPEMWIMEDEYTAGVSEDKTFVTTLARLSGTGSCSLQASATQPAFLYVDFIR